jgi:hypothetical protein
MHIHCDQHRPTREACLREKFAFIVGIPYDIATEVRHIPVNDFTVQQSSKVRSYNRRAHFTKRQYVRKEIIEWLKHSIGEGNYGVGPAATHPVNFFFKTKEQAALFKLFWY